MSFGLLTGTTKEADGPLTWKLLYQSRKPHLTVTQIVWYNSQLVSSDLIMLIWFWTLNQWSITIYCDVNNNTCSIMNWNIQTFKHLCLFKCLSWLMCKSLGSNFRSLSNVDKKVLTLYKPQVSEPQMFLSWQAVKEIINLVSVTFLKFHNHYELQLYTTHDTEHSHTL